MCAKPGAILSGMAAERLPGSTTDYVCLCGPDTKRPTLVQTSVYSCFSKDTQQP